MLDKSSGEPGPGLPAKPMNAISRDCRRRQDLFLAAYAKHGIVGVAASEAGVPLGTLNFWIMNDTQSFKSRKDSAGQVALGVLEAEVHRRGVIGVERPLVHHGRRTGDYITEYSDNLLMFRAKRLDPAYKDNYQPAPSLPNTVTQVNIHLHPDAAPATRAVAPDVVDADVPGSINVTSADDGLQDA